MSNDNSSTPQPQDIALVLSAGGAKGYAHIGVIKALEESGNRITSIAGTSMGALVGGLYAAGKLEEAFEWLKTLDNWQLFKLADLKNFSKKGIIDGEYVFNELKRIVGNVRIEELPISYCAIAADLDTGEEVVFRRGKLLDAIRASVSLPVYFAPHVIRNRRLVDGGVVNGMPINHVVRHEGDIVVAINIDTYGLQNTYRYVHEKSHGLFASLFRKKEEETEPQSGNNLISILLNSFYISLKSNKIMMKEMMNPDIYVHINTKGHGSNDFDSAEEIAKQGYRQMKKEITRYRAWKVEQQRLHQTPAEPAKGSKAKGKK